MKKEEKSGSPLPKSHEEDDSIPPQPIEDQVHDLNMRFNTFWDKT